MKTSLTQERVSVGNEGEKNGMSLAKGDSFQYLKNLGDKSRAALTFFFFLSHVQDRITTKHTKEKLDFVETYQKGLST